MSRLHKLPKVLETSNSHHGSATVRRDVLEIAQGLTHAYYSVITSPYSVIILPITDQGEYVLVREYRHPTNRIILGCAGGRMEEGEDPLEAARRELLEETGYDAASYTLLATAFPLPGLAPIEAHFVRANGAVRVQELKLEPAEYLEPVLLTPQQLRQEIASGTHVDAHLLSALYLHG